MIAICVFNLIIFRHLSQSQLSVGDDILSDDSGCATSEIADVQRQSRITGGGWIHASLAVDESDLELAPFAHHVEKVLVIDVAHNLVSS